MKRITIQGIAGCYHETAARAFFRDERIEVLPCATFEQLFGRMAADPSLPDIAAIENTIAGSLLPNHELLRSSRLRIVGEQKSPSTPRALPDGPRAVRPLPSDFTMLGEYAQCPNPSLES